MKSPWVVIPTYNEKDNIERLITSLFGLGVGGLSVLVVDDNSPDGTSRVVRRLQEQYPALKLIVTEARVGFGRSYIRGFSHALQEGATHIVQMDADFSHDPCDVPRLLGALDIADVAAGSRYSRGISVVNWPLKRLLISIAGNRYARAITGLPFKDVTGGFRAWRASALAAIDVPTVTTDGYGFLITILYRAWKQGLVITEVPITFTERRDGQSKMSTTIMREAALLVWRLRIWS